MDAVYLRGGCKINLFLRVGRRLESGYHELRSLMLPLSEPHDRIVVKPIRKAGASGLVVRFYALDEAAEIRDIDPENNTLTKAYRWFERRTGFAPPLSLDVHKGIPQGAGLGGGSSDAALFLSFLCSLGRGPDRPSDDAVFLRDSAEIGADVPFFLLREPALVSGMGEELAACSNPCSGLSLLLVCPGIGISTAWAFRALDMKRRGRITALPGSLDPLSLMRLGNDFEELVFERHPETEAVRDLLLSYGAKTARLTGTGSALFGLFCDAGAAQKGQEELARRGYSVYRQQLL
ncbi:MAG: 4-(cytidine 5'-diphospho)-2-C-methyl-D-erythritol kinase [Desulfovibrio sp.]|nr:4-(cytidine 5'-diphospho)-2-C-methyl-D-erythritol kinase [Desulfovibrio sp.]